MKLASRNLTDRLKALITGDGLRERLVKASGGALILKVLNTVLGFATTVILARTLGPDSFGVYAFAIAVVMVVGLPAKAGVPQLVTRETARGQASGDWRTVKGVWRWATIFVLITSTIVLILAVSAGAFFSDFAVTEVGRTLLIGLLMIPFMGLALVRASSLRGLGYTVQGQLPELVVKPMTFLILLLAVLFIDDIGELSAPWAMTLNIAATMLAFVFGIAMLRRVRPSEFKEIQPQYESRSWMATVIPMASVNAMHLINTQADILLIGFFMESADIGHYKVAAQVSLVVVFGLQATKMVVEPYYSRFYHRGEMVRLQKLARSASRVNLVVALLVITPLFFLGRELLNLAFGAAFVAAFVPMLVLSAARLIGSAIGSSGHLLNMAGYQKEYARIWVLAAVLNVILNLILIPLFGVTGAAISTAGTLLLASIFGWWAAKKWIGCDCLPFSIIK
jgi:O-antigen/teichoic acid export membrane protein